jgi:hypothetical protein
MAVALAASNSVAGHGSELASFIEECTKRDSQVDKPFYYIENCRTTFRGVRDVYVRRRSIDMCEKQRKQIATWCQLRSEFSSIRSENDKLHSLEDEIRNRGIVLKVLTELLQ